MLRDYDSDGNINKYYLEYYHDAQPRREGNMPGRSTQTSTLISAAEGNSLLYWNTPYDSAAVDTDGSITGVPGKLVTGTYAGLNNVVLGNGDYSDPTDNFANGWLNHFYIYADLEGTDPGRTPVWRRTRSVSVWPAWSSIRPIPARPCSPWGRPATVRRSTTC